MIGLINRLSERIVLALTLALVFSIVLVGWHSWKVWDIYNLYKEEVSRQHLLLKHSADVVYFDETLTTSARMYALTGGSQWLARHELHAPKLDAAVRAINAVDPDILREHESFDTTAEELLALEERALELVSVGQPHAATELLLGDRYLELKQAFSVASLSTEQAVRQRVEVQNHEYQERFSDTLRMTLITMGLLALGWLLVLVGVRRNVAQRDRAERDLGNLNVELEQRIAERTADLADNERKFRVLIDSVPGAVYQCALDWTITFYSEAIEELTGYPASDFVGNAVRRYGGLVHPDDAASVFPEVEQAVAAHEPYAIEYRITTASNETKWIFAQGRAIYSQAGEPEGLQGVVFDITEIKRVQQELRVAKEGAEAGGRAKSEFLAAMSHEIRTPMNGVIGMIDLLGQSDMDADQTQMLGTIKDSAFSLLNIINDILDFSKIEAGKLDLEHIGISVRDVIGGVSDTLAPNVTKKGLDLVCFVDPRIPAKVLGDQVRLRQILFNLAGNAVKFTEQGRVMIRAVRVDSNSRDIVRIRYEVVDQGIGIPGDKVESLFTPFSQAERSTTRRFGGTGLGLTICASLTELMGGTIAVDSTPGEGSTFAVTIPHDAPTEGVADDLQLDLGRLRILVASKDEARVEVMRSYLAVWGNTVEVIVDAEQLEARVRSGFEDAEPVKIIVQGQDIPDEQHRALRERFQSDRVLNRTRFVVLCADHASAREILSNGSTVEALPLRREVFLRAVAVAAGRASPDIPEVHVEKARPVKQAPSVAEAEAQGQLILVAEDNLTNQAVIRRQLKVLGYAADIEPDGQQALEALGRKRYALLLTDCHMPEIDGYELTQAVREREKAQDGDARLPIVAITANALQGEAEKCLAVGMDDYLSKPLEMRKLKSMLEKWMSVESSDASASVLDQVAASPADPVAPVTDTTEGPVDLSFLIDCFGDDEDTHRDILQEFASSTDDYVDSILNAVNGDSSTEIASLAHAFKSAARTVGAHELADLCQGLEHAGKADNWDEIRTLSPRLKPAMVKVGEFIEGF